jgi:RNA-directed DNA polymerase
MSREAHVRFYEGLGVRLPGATHRNIFVRSERAGQRVMESTRRFLERKLRLQINEEKSSVTAPWKVHFLGFRFSIGEGNRVKVKLSIKAQARLSTKIRELTPRSWVQSLETCFDELNEYCRGWMGHFRLCTEEGASEFRKFDAHLRRRLRAMVIHQKKRARFLYRHLVQRGATPQRAAGAAYSRRGIWHRSNSPGMTKAYSNTWFATQWTSLYDLWWVANPPVEVSDQLSLAMRDPQVRFCERHGGATRRAYSTS